MRKPEAPKTVGDLLDLIKPGETLRIGGLQVRRWAEPEPVEQQRATNRPNEGGAA